MWLGALSSTPSLRFNFRRGNNVFSRTLLMVIRAKRRSTRRLRQWRGGNPYAVMMQQLIAGASRLLPVGVAIGIKMYRDSRHTRRRR